MDSLQKIFTDPSNVIFLIIISGIFFIAFILFVRGKATEFVNYAPTLLTTLGIFGTFFGIFLGLMEFDQNNVEASIPPLLGGLKIAFFTSLAGILSSLILKTITTSSWFRPSATEDEPTDASPELILATMQAQLEATKELQSSLVGDEDSTLIGQIKILRADINDQMKRLMVQSNKEFNDHKAIFENFSDRLWIQLQDFSDTLSRSATETVINALREVISDFNNNLTEQFGDNFSQLNEAVIKLVEWQERYKQQLEKMDQQYQQGVKAITDTAYSVNQISEQTQAIPAVMNDLREIMTVNQQQISELNRHLDAFRDMRDKAVEAVPQIREQIDLIISEVTKSVKKASDHYQELLTGSDTYIRNHAETTQGLLEKFTTQTTQATDEFGNRVATVVNTVQEQVAEGATALKNQLLDSSDEIRGQLISGSEAIGERLNDGASSIQNATTEIEKLLTDAAGNLQSNIKEMIDQMVNGSNDLGETLSKANRSLIEDTGAARDASLNALTDIQQRLESAINETANRHKELAQITLETIESQIQEKIGLTTEVIDNQMQAIDQQMQQELNRVMTEMGRALAQVTGQFTQDYSRLVQAMQAIVMQGD